MRVSYLIFVIVFVLLILTPSFQFFTGYLPKKGLSGIVVHRKLPELTLSKVNSGEYQRKMERWFMQNTGLWGVFVTTENQLNFSLFDQVSTDYKSSVVIGKKSTPLQREYLDDYNRLSLSGRKRLKNRVERLAELQALLKEKGVGFVLLVSPNKVNLYPELLKNSFVLESRLSIKRNYEHFSEFLSTMEINHFDAHDYFSNRRKDYPNGAFAKSGSHWNDVATCVVTRELVREIEKQLGKKLRSFSCEPIKLREFPRAPDRDLAKITNLWDSSPLYAPTPYPVTKTIADGSEYRPRILFVGSSFLWSVLRFMDHHKIYSKRDMYYYFRTNHAYPSGRKHNIDSVPWDRDFLKNDVVIVEINESKVREVGFGFVEAALENIKR